MTLQVLQEYGGVCGAVSKFTTSVCQSLGMPAFPVGQPGHCAHMWLDMCEDKRTWKNGNNVFGLSTSSRHSGISLVWEDITRYAWTTMIMEKALEDQDSFAMSELYLDQAELLKIPGTKNCI